MPESIMQFAERFDLQVALLMIGAILILFLLSYNLLRTRRVKNQLASRLAQTILMEKNADSERLAEPVSVDQVPSRVEPSFQNHQNDDLSVGVHDSSDMPTQDLVSEPPALSSSKMDPNVDCVVSLHFSLLVPGNELLERISKWSVNPSYRFACEGQFENESTSLWEILHPNHMYRELQLSMQLANRRGPISREELSEFLGMAAELANEFSAEIDLPPIAQVLSQAQDLDQFAVQCDIQLAFNLVPNMISWEPKDVEKALLNRGFTLARDGLSFNYFLQNTLVFKAQIPGLNFLTDDLQTARIKCILFALEVPLVAEESRAFMTMFETAEQLAKDLDGKVLDDNGKLLEIKSVDAIEAQLEPVYALMRDREILPGSISALRLFS
jgi:ZipA, C-terminal FtsZ-binding domain